MSRKWLEAAKRFELEIGHRMGRPARSVEEEVRALQSFVNSADYRAAKELLRVSGERLHIGSFPGESVEWRRSILSDEAEETRRTKVTIYCVLDEHGFRKGQQGVMPQADGNFVFCILPAITEASTEDLAIAALTSGRIPPMDYIRHRLDLIARELNERL